jgi:riboflavin kinase/FMN adenylyltransferase
VLVIREGEPLTPLERTVVTVGVFDGVHRGHQHLLREARNLADELDGPLVAVMFDRHPNTVVRPEAVKLLLSDLKQRLAWLEAARVDVTYILRFDEERSLESPADFVESVLVERLHAAVHVSGEDHHFGHRASGDTAVMAQLSTQHGIKASSVPMLRTDQGWVISSDLVRARVVDGDVVGAAELLERPFELHGVVEHGDHRGRQLGFPTANVAVAGDMALPRDGVYAGWYVRPDGSEHAAAINIGRRPTFYDENGLLLVEAHLLDFDGDLYGERPRVRFFQRLRDEVRFDGLEALVAQLRKDVATTRELLL